MMRGIARRRREKRKAHVLSLFLSLSFSLQLVSSSIIILDSKESSFIF